jgi:hypothetical protein
VQNAKYIIENVISDKATRLNKIKTASDAMTGKEPACINTNN